MSFETGFGFVVICLALLASGGVSADFWRKVQVVLYKRHLIVWMNGIKVIDGCPVAGVTGGAFDSDDLKPVPIYLRGDHSEDSYRDMILTRIVKG